MRGGRAIAPSAGWVLGCLTLLAGPVSSGSLDVNPTAASEGSEGLEVTVGPVCTEDDVVISGGTFQGDSTIACDSLMASNVQIVAPGATLKAGNVVRLGNGFSVAAGATLTTVVDSQFVSSFAYVQNASPVGEDSYLGHFSINLSPLTMVSGEIIHHLKGYSAAGVVQFRASLQRNVADTENHLVIAVRKDDGTLEQLPTGFLLPAGYNRVTLWWRAGNGDGQFLAGINGAAPSGLTNLINDTSRIDYVRWGAVDGSLSSSTGSFYLDDFWSSRWR
jgi:hypothetical protein